jgi:hypothetical protein
MSLRINKDNIFFILPEDRYSVSARIDNHMSKDFTLYVKQKINADFLEVDKEHYVFARNGMHSGISIYKDLSGGCHVVYSWWIRNKNTGVYEYEKLTHRIDDRDINEHNEYVMICDDTVNKEIKCYFNDYLVGKISFQNAEKNSYEGAFYWFGCGSMICEEQYRQIGDFDFDLSFLLNKKITKEEVTDIVQNYKSKYTYQLLDGLRKFHGHFYLKDNFAFFCDFDNSTRYKIWDMTFSGNYPQIYIEDNIYF